MEALWVAAAFALGLLASRLALPPLVGYLVAGFLLAGAGIRGTAFLHQIAEIGVLLLLFSVGLKLRLKDLLDPRVLLSGGLHLGLFAALAFLYTKNLPLAIALGFSSTVLVAKVLEDKKELTSYHGRIALGILVFQDLVAVGLLTLYGGEGVSPWAALVLLFPLLRQGVAWLLEKSGHEELLVLFGLGMALGSGELFQHVGLSPELGALLTGALLSGHAKSAELTKGLWSLKEAFLVAFFLDIGLREGLQGLDLGLAAGLTLLFLLKAPLFFLVLLLVGYRARTAFVAGMYLSNHSEFALIVGVALERAGLFADLSALALAVALSMALSAPLARYSHTLYKRLEPFLLRLERPGSHPDAEPEHLEGTVLVVGMGRTGDAVYRVLEAQGESPVGLDADPAKVERHREKGRRVLYGDAEDPELWERLDLRGLKAVVLALPDLEAKALAARWLKERGFQGLVAATSYFPEEDPVLAQEGAHLIFHPFQEAGERLGERVLESLAIMGKVNYGRSQQMGSD
ncbi:cation:proton antiporter family protein [Thermus thermophilus]|uniref:cation:proton antiporter family protein n=1 Tax=Thermus thermophilus TaxID=274 RepID=UPI001C73E7C7|nr:cation:proton antiporter family protein [Thermus thermophilus]BCZ89088.1 potassium transporter KefC [Thermus thermophilus]